MSDVTTIGIDLAKARCTAWIAPAGTCCSGRCGVSTEPMSGDGSSAP